MVKRVVALIGFVHGLILFLCPLVTEGLEDREQEQTQKQQPFASQKTRTFLVEGRAVLRQASFKPDIKVG